MKLWLSGIGDDRGIVGLPVEEIRKILMNSDFLDFEIEQVARNQGRHERFKALYDWKIIIHEETMVAQ